MIYLSQRDNRWGGKTIGKSNSLIKDYGCTITSISMLSDYFGCYKDPAWLAKNLSFDVDKVIWKSISEKLCFKFVWRFYQKNMVEFSKALKAKDMACLFEVNKNHWVVGIRKSTIPWSKYWLVADPWTGQKNWYHENQISGGAIFKK